MTDVKADGFACWFAAAPWAGAGDVLLLDAGAEVGVDDGEVAKREKREKKQK